MMRTTMKLGLLFACMALGLVQAGTRAMAQDGGATGSWVLMLGTAVDISINVDGQAYITDQGGTPWRWDKAEQRWRRMSGKFVRITAAEGNRPWAVDKKGVVFRYNGLWWENKATDVMDVAADTNGNVFIAKTDGTIEKWYALRSEWRPFKDSEDGPVRRISVGPDGKPWTVLNDGRIRSFDGKSWVDYPGWARDIALGGTDVVMIADVVGKVRRWNGVQNNWSVVPGIKKATALGVTPEGKAWVVVQDGTIWTNGVIVSQDTPQEEDTATDPKAKVPTPPVNTAKVDTPSVPTVTTPTATVPTVDGATAGVTGSSTTATDAGDPATITTQDKITFINTLKSASSLAIGADGSVFALDIGGNVLRWSNKKKAFDSFPGTLVRIAADKDGHPWGISALGRVFRHTGSQWKQIPNATASDISIGYDGTVLIASAAGRLYKLNEKQTVFTPVPGSGATMVAAGPDGTPWTIRTDKLVQRCNVTPCKVYGQKAKSIAIGPDGSVWIVSKANRLMRLNEMGKFQAIQTPGHTPHAVAVGPMGYPWVVSSANIALASAYFDRAEGGDTSQAAATSASGTTGTGSTSSVVSTASSSSFVFTKNLSFVNVAHTNLSPGMCPLLESDANGVIWAHSFGGELEQYDATKRKFVAKSTAFDWWDHVAFDVAPNGAIWASTLNPHTGLYRAYKGTTKQYSISGATYYEDVSVAPDGTVYVAVSISGPRYLYYKSPNSQVFKRFSTYNNVRQVSVGAGGDVWIVDANIQARRWNGSSFVKPENVTFGAADISVSKVDGTVYVRENGTAALHKWNPTNKSFDKVNNLTVDTFAVDGDGRPWICNDTTPIIKRAKD